MAINLKAYKDPEQRSLRIQCADKYAVRQHVADHGLSRILNECYGIYDKFEDIDFDSLPDQFVLKVTNGSGQNYICKNKSEMNYGEIQSLFNKWMDESHFFGLRTGEWHYSAIKPRIMIEKYLSTLGEDKSIIDYKFHCIHGKIFGILVCYDRDIYSHRLNLDLYDTEWNLTDGILPEYHTGRRSIPKPESFNEMCIIAEELSRGIDYVRIDMYEIDGKPLFGEMTFTPAGNIMLKHSPSVLNSMLHAYEEKTYE